MSLQECKATYIPMETLELEHSISAAQGNLFLSQPSSETSFSGHLGLLLKGRLSLHELHLSEEVQSFKSLRPSPIIPESHVNHAKWIKLQKQEDGGNLNVLVVLSSSGIYIFSQDGIQMLGSFEYSSSSSSHPDSICRALGSTTCQILAGNFLGELFTFIATPEGNVKLMKTEKIQDEPITQITSHHQTLATGSTSGSIRVWKSKSGRAIKLCSFKTHKEECVTGLAVWGSKLISTYGSGVIRIFDLTARRILARVAAHSRWIGTMDFVPTAKRTGLLLTISEDERALIWSLEKGGESSGPEVEVNLNSSIGVENMLLVGGKFVTGNGSVIALSNYGAKQIYLYRRL